MEVEHIVQSVKRTWTPQAKKSWMKTSDRLVYIKCLLIKEKKIYGGTMLQSFIRNATMKSLKTALKTLTRDWSLIIKRQRNALMITFMVQESNIKRRLLSLKRKKNIIKSMVQASSQDLWLTTELIWECLILQMSMMLCVLDLKHLKRNVRRKIRLELMEGEFLQLNLPF